MDSLTTEPGASAPVSAADEPREPSPAAGRFAVRLGAKEVALGVVALGGAAAAAAGFLPATAAALFLVGGALALWASSLVAPFLAVLLPIGFSLTSVHGVQVPLLHAAVVGAATGHALLLYRERRRPDLGFPDILFGAFVAGVALSGAGPVAKAPWLHDVVLWSGLALVVHCTSRALSAAAARRRVYVALAGAGVFESVYAIVQYAQASDARFFRLGGAIVYPQPDATLEHPNALGSFLVLALLVLVGAALAEKRRRARGLGLGVVVVLGLGTITPFSRAAWLSLAAGVAALVVTDRRNRRLLAAAAAALVLGAAAVAGFDNGALGARLTSLFSGHSSSLYGFRATLASRALDVIAHHPLTGAGRFVEYGLYAGRPTIATHPHDLLLGVAVFFGIPAALAFAGLLVLAVRAAWRSSRSPNVRLAAEGAGVLAALVALLVNGLFDYLLWNTALTVEIALLLALATALGRATRPAQE